MLDDSDQDFSDLCSRLLKRVKRKDPGEEKKTTAVKDEEAGPSQSKAKRKRLKPGQLQGEEGPSRTQSGCPAQGASSLGVKEKVLRRMGRFRRESPPRLLHVEEDKAPSDTPPPHKQDPLREPESDEALAQRLQQQLDSEARIEVSLNAEDRQLFVCQLCYKDLSAMSPQLRTQHINRCLDESESSASEVPQPPPPPPRPRVPECPICGRGFKSEKSRSTHLKRCSTSMGVSPVELLQALQRQAAEGVSDSAANRIRREHPPESSMPNKKKARKKAPSLDEDTMVALALSRSLLEQEKEQERELEEERQIQEQLSSPPTGAAAVLHWRPRAGKKRGKRRKGAPAAPPPLLLVQDSQTALNRIQERVSSLLLCPRPPSPPTPKLLSSTLPLWMHSTPLWLKSALPEGGPHLLCEFYTPELETFIEPWIRPEKQPSLSSEVTPVKQPPALETTADPEQPSCAPLFTGQKPTERPSTPACLTPTLNTPGTQALQDLMELAEEGMTLTQYRHSDKEAAVAELSLSGFVPETKKKNTKLSASSVSMSRLCSDLASMVNNPQLSDVQLQVDSGDVYFAHLFILYTRCPLLANMVHNTGFGVQEDGMPTAQRVLLGDVPGEAVYVLLQYLYTALCPLTHTLLPHVHLLATRFGLTELQQQCEQYSGDPEDSSEEVCPAEESPDRPQQSFAETQFLDLLRSMWQHDESDVEEFGEAGGTERGMVEDDEGGGSGDGERVDEEELDEIYEFAATQRRMETTTSSTTNDEEAVTDFSDAETKQDVEAEQKKTASSHKEAEASHHSYRIGEEEVAAMVTRATNVHHTLSSHAGVCLDTKSDTHGHLTAGPDASVDRSYSRLFSESWGEYMEPSQSPSTSSQSDQKHKPVPRRVSSVSEVIDLSISPPPCSTEPGESSLPVPGVSPGEEEASKPTLNIVPPLYPSTLNSSQSKCSPVELLGPLALSKARPKLSPSIPSSTKPEFSPPVPSKSLLNPPPPSCTQPELIVLSDSSDDMDPDPPADSVLAQGCTPSPSPSPPKISQSYTKIRAKESMDGKLSFKNTDQNELLKPEESGGGTGDQSMLDGSAEVSWLIPATPEVSTRSSSMPTFNSMRRTQLFPKSCSSSSSSVPENSNTHSTFLKERPGSISSDCSDSSRQNSAGDVPEHSPVFQKPVSYSRLQTDTPQFIKQTYASPCPGTMPSSSTPLHSAPHPQPPEPLGSPLLRDCELRQQSTAAWEKDEDDEGAARSLSQQEIAVAAAKRLSQLKNSELGSMQLDPSANLPSERSSFEHEEKAPMDPNHAETERESASETEMRHKEEDVPNEENNSANEVEMVQEASFCFMDEPPIAFDDSWGLGGDMVGGQGPCFSLRLESSGDPDSPSEPRRQSEKAAPLPLSPAGDGAQNSLHVSEALINHSLPDPVVWDDWEKDDDEDDNDEEEEGAALPLSQRLGAVAPPKRVAQLKTPVARNKKNQAPLVPITPMPGFSDMDTPELKKRLDRFGVRPLPKKQMVLKLKEIHQYTHQLMSSESEEEASPRGRPRPRFPLAAPTHQPELLGFKQPTAPPPVSPRKLQFCDEEQDALPSSQDSNTSSTAESERSNPELCESADDSSDSEGITASQAAVREKDKLLAVRSFILSDPVLYGRVLQYQPLSLSELKVRLRAAGIRLGTAKLLDFLDSQCITFSTAKPGPSAPSRRRARAPAAGPGRAGGRGRKRTAKPD